MGTFSTSIKGGLPTLYSQRTLFVSGEGCISHFANCYLNQVSPSCPTFGFAITGKKLSECSKPLLLSTPRGLWGSPCLSQLLPATLLLSTALYSPHSFTMSWEGPLYLSPKSYNQFLFSWRKEGLTLQALLDDDKIFQFIYLGHQREQKTKYEVS